MHLGDHYTEGLKRAAYRMVTCGRVAYPAVGAKYHTRLPSGCAGALMLLKVPSRSVLTSPLHFTFSQGHQN